MRYIVLYPNPGDTCHTLHVSESLVSMATPTQTAPAEELVLPGWLGELLKPGVGPGIFTTLKLSLVCLVLTLCVMLIYIEDEVSTQRMITPRAPLRSPVHAHLLCGLFTRRTIIFRAPTLSPVHVSCSSPVVALRAQTARLHLSIFLGMSVVLLVLVVWFIGELQAAEIKEKKEKKKEK